MRSKHSNVSKRERDARPAKPEFAWLGVLVGLVAGWITGFALEVVLNRPMKLIMLAAGFAGVALGLALEGLRFWVRLRRYKASRNA